MEFYYIFPLFVFVIAAIGYKRNSTGIFLIGLLLFFSMFRGDNVGTDTMHYLDLASNGDRKLLAFEEEGGIKTRFELLFYLLYYFIYVFDLDPRISIYTFSVLTFVFLYLSAKRLNVSIALVGLFFVFGGFYFYSFNIARQLAAACIGLYGITFLREESSKRFLFFLWTIIGCLLHNSIIINLILYPIRNICYNRRRMAYIVLLLFVILYFLPTFDIIQSIVSQTGIAIFDKYGNEGSYDASNKNVVGVLADLINVSVLIFIFLFRNKNRYTDSLDVFFLLSLLMMALLSSGNLGSWRLMINFTLFHCIYIASVYENKSKELFPVFFLLLFYNYYITVQIDNGVYYLQF